MPLLQGRAVPCVLTPAAPASQLVTVQTGHAVHTWSELRRQGRDAPCTDPAVWPVSPAPQAPEWGAGPARLQVLPTHLRGQRRGSRGPRPWRGKRTWRWEVTLRPWSRWPGGGVDGCRSLMPLGGPVTADARSPRAVSPRGSPSLQAHFPLLTGSACQRPRPPWASRGPGDWHSL